MPALSAKMSAVGWGSGSGVVPPVTVTVQVAVRPLTVEAVMVAVPGGHAGDDALGNGGNGGSARGPGDALIRSGIGVTVAVSCGACRPPLWPWMR